MARAGMGPDKTPPKAVTIRSRWKPNLSLNAWLRIGIGVALVLAFFLHESEVYQYRFIQQLELLAYDARLRLFMPEKLDPRIVILDIDEKSLNAEGRWPWSRDKLARMVHQLFEKYHIRTVGFDVAFAEKDPSSGVARFEEVARKELKDNAEYQAWLAANRKSLDYDQIFADEIGKYPVVLGFFLGAKQDKAGVLPAPMFNED